MRPIPFTQYLMPNGRKAPGTIERPEPIAQKAQAIIDAGYRFECEMLSDYRSISVTIFDPRIDEDVAIELVANGPEVLIAIDRIITGFAVPAVTSEVTS